MVSTDVVRVSEPAMCTLRLSIRVFTPLPDGNEKTKNPGSDRRFFYITPGGGGRFLYPPLVRWERDVIRPSFLSFGRLRCFVEIRSWFVHLAGVETMVVARCFTDLSLPHPPKLPSQIDKQIGLSELIY
jgi:hypothetical protein